MENIEKKTPLNDLMDTTMDKIRDMVDSNTIIGEPITTPDGVTVIPVSRVSFGFGAAATTARPTPHTSAAAQVRASRSTPSRSSSSRTV